MSCHYKDFDKDRKELTKELDERLDPDASVSEILQRLERFGLVRRNGEYRNGQPVYVSTEIDELLN